MVFVPILQNVTSYYLVFRIQTHLVKPVATASVNQIIVQMGKAIGIKEVTWSINQMTLAQEPYAV